MDKVLKECFVKPLDDRHPPIRIKAERTFLGRNPETQIQDPFCSRQQVLLKANLSQGLVLVKLLGSNPSVLNGKQLEKNIDYEARDGDILELLPATHQYTFVLKFEEKEKKKSRDKSKNVSKEKDARDSRKRSLSKDDKRDKDRSKMKKRD